MEVRQRKEEKEFKHLQELYSISKTSKIIENEWRERERERE